MIHCLICFYHRYFFASIGLKVELPKMSAAIVGFAVALTIVAVLTKVVGCGFGAKSVTIRIIRQTNRNRYDLAWRSSIDRSQQGRSTGAVRFCIFRADHYCCRDHDNYYTSLFWKVVFAPGTAPVPEQIVPESERVKTI